MLALTQFVTDGQNIINAYILAEYVALFTLNIPQDVLSKYVQQLD